MKIYLATSWRNGFYVNMLEQIRGKGYETYDFRDPEYAFKWSDLDAEWLDWTPEAFVKTLRSPECFRGFQRDMKALRECDLCVLLLPCGRSAHIEAGWAKGAGKKLVIYLKEEDFEPELMYKMADSIVTTPEELFRALRKHVGE